MRGARRASIFCSTYVVTFAARLAQCEGDYVSRTDRVAIAPSLFRVFRIDSERGSRNGIKNVESNDEWLYGARAVSTIANNRVFR